MGCSRARPSAACLVEAEQALCVVLQGLLATRHGLIAWRLGVFGFSHLHDGAAAVPAVGRIVGFPEGVALRQCDTVEGGMLRPDFVVAGRAILKVVAVAIFGILLPLGRHLR